MGPGAAMAHAATGDGDSSRSREACSPRTCQRAHRSREDIFGALRDTGPGHGGEIQLTDALAGLVARGEPVHGVVLRGRRHDIGDRLGNLRAVVELALERDDLGPALASLVREMVSVLPSDSASPS